MKIALYKSQYGYSSPIAIDDDDSCWADDDGGYVRVSEVVEVEFPELDRKTVLDKQLAVIDKQIQSVRAECEVKIGRLDRQKQELLALPAGVAE